MGTFFILEVVPVYLFKIILERVSKIRSEISTLHLWSKGESRWISLLHRWMTSLQYWQTIYTVLPTFLINYHIVIFNGHLFKKKKTVCAVLRIFLLTLQQSVNLKQILQHINLHRISWKIVANHSLALFGESLRWICRVSSAQTEAKPGSFDGCSMRLDQDLRWCSGTGYSWLNLRIDTKVTWNGSLWWWWQGTENELLS